MTGKVDLVPEAMDPGDARLQQFHDCINSLLEYSKTAVVGFGTPLHSPDTLKWSIAQALHDGGHSSFSEIPLETLQLSVQPVLEGLKRIDAEALLRLQRTIGESGGARVFDGVIVKPIHDSVSPPCDNATVRYIHLNEVPGRFSMGIFVFPPYSKIPLHDHPGMCVLSRVLYGELNRLSLDLVREEQPPKLPRESLWRQWSTSWARKSKLSDLPEGSKRAYRSRIDHLQAPDCTVLYPYEGNLHEFAAGPNGAAVLDILLPPYDPDTGRDCMFYEIQECTSPDDHLCKETIEGLVWIIPTGQPESFHCISGEYAGFGS